MIIRQISRSGEDGRSLIRYDVCISGISRFEDYLSNKKLNGYHQDNNSAYTKFILRIIK